MLGPTSGGLTTWITYRGPGGSLLGAVDFPQGVPQKVHRTRSFRGPPPKKQDPRVTNHFQVDGGRSGTTVTGHSFRGHGPSFLPRTSVGHQAPVCRRTSRSLRLTWSLPVDMPAPTTQGGWIHPQCQRFTSFDLTPKLVGPYARLVFGYAIVPSTRCRTGARQVDPGRSTWAIEGAGMGDHVPDRGGVRSGKKGTPTAVHQTTNPQRIRLGHLDRVNPTPEHHRVRCRTPFPEGDGTR